LYLPKHLLCKASFHSPQVTQWFTRIVYPLFVGITLFLIYSLAQLRSCCARVVGRKLLKRFKIKYVRPLKDEENSSSDDERQDHSIKSKFCLGIRTIMNGMIYLRNLLIYSMEHVSSREDMKILINKLINALSAFVNFSYISLISTAAELFVCSRQPDRLFTLNSSPDIFW
jgi:hypothetical protein